MAKFMPMLACDLDKSKIKYPVIVQPKLDGIRCIVRDGIGYSRSMKQINNRHIQSLIRESADVLEGVDGELILGDPTNPMCYRLTTSGVMSHHGEPNITYYLFDLWNVPTAPYTQRLAALVSRLLPMEWCQLVDNAIATNEEELLAAHTRLTQAGHEGSILRGPDTPYKYNRSTAKEGYLIKFKDFKDAEAVIMDFEEKYHNQNEAKLDERGFTKRSSENAGMVPANTLGAIVVGMDCHTLPDLNDPARLTTFKIGTGFDDELRKWIWERRGELKGKMVKFKYFEGGAYNVPRFPVFLGFRDE